MSIESEMFSGFLAKSWTGKDARDVASGKMLGSTFGFCAECLGSRATSGLHLGATGIFRGGGVTGPETGDGVYPLREGVSRGDKPVGSGMIPGAALSSFLDGMSRGDKPFGSGAIPSWVTSSTHTGYFIPMEIPDCSMIAGAEDCGVDYDSQLSECESPYPNVQHIEDFLAIDPDSDGSNFDFEWDVEPGEGDLEEERTLLRTAWALLKQNIDLVRWAVCWVRGSDDDLADALEEHLFAEYGFLGTGWVNIHIHGTYETCLGSDPFNGYSDVLGGGLIDICRPSFAWRQLCRSGRSQKMKIVFVPH